MLAIVDFDMMSILPDLFSTVWTETLRNVVHLFLAPPPPQAPPLYPHHLSPLRHLSNALHQMPARKLSRMRNRLVWRWTHPLPHPLHQRKVSPLYLTMWLRPRQAILLSSGLNDPLPYIIRRLTVIAVTRLWRVRLFLLLQFLV